MKNLSKKPVRVIVAVILILIVVVVAVIQLFADIALKVGIEAAASKTLNVGVSVDDVDLSILGGKLGIENLVINNPPGYQHETLLELGEVKVDVEVTSLLSDTVKIKEIKLDGMNVVLEQRGVSGNNIQDVISSIGAKGEKPEEEEKQEEPEAEGKKLRIDNLEISNVVVNVKLLPVPGKKDTLVMKLEPIKMTDLGSDDKLDTAILSSKILVAIADGVAKQGAGVLPDEMVSTMKSTLSETLKLGETASEEGKKLIDASKDIAEGLKGLLKPKK